MLTKTLTLAFGLVLVVTTSLFGQPLEKIAPGRIDASHRTESTKSSVRVVQLRPAPDTDVILPEVLLTTNDQTSIKVSFGGQLTNGELLRLFYVIDPKQMTYALLKLTDDDIEDAKRVRRAQLARGKDIRDSELVERLSRSRLSAKDKTDRLGIALKRRGNLSEFMVPETCPQPPSPALEQELQSHGPHVDDDAAQSYGVYCHGAGWADVETWEIAVQLGLSNDFLNKTHVALQWDHYLGWNGHSYSYVWDTSTAPCYAIPVTFLGTHWFTDYCSGPVFNEDGANFDATTVGLYHNTDFIPMLSYHLGFFQFPSTGDINVTGTASVQRANGNSYYANFIVIDAPPSTAGWLQYILENGLLQGQATALVSQQETGCQLYCDSSPDEVWNCEHGQEDYHFFDWGLTCTCLTGASPIIIDLDRRNRLELTGVQDGVVFDMLSNGRPVHTAWTKAGTREAFLVLDRNRNGRIDNSSEMFGNFTAQPLPDTPSKANGFAALEIFDDPATGGNGDGQISKDDEIFSSLRLWIDANHDGVSQSEELRALDEGGVVAISLRYIVTGHRDEYGNAFRFRSTVTMDSDAFAPGPTKRSAIDVFFTYARIP